MQRLCRLLCALTVHSLLLPGFSSAAAPEETRLTVIVPEARVRKNSVAGTDQILVAGYTHAGAPGDPLLPARRFQIAIPPDVDEASVVLEFTDALFSDCRAPLVLQAAPPLRASVPSRPHARWGQNEGNIVEGKNRKVFENDALFPPAVAALESISRMRQWRVANVTVFAAQYNPVTGAARTLKQGTIRLRYSRRLLSTREQRELGDTQMTREASMLISNFNDAPVSPAASPPALLTPPSEGTGYVIVTTESIRNGSEKLHEFKDHKKSRGYSVRIVTELDYGSLAGGTAEKIREWLRDNYVDLQIRYVLLIGNPDPSLDMVPMKLMKPRLYAGDGYDDTPTDYYYADLTGNWDLSGDGNFGDYFHDRGPAGVDFAPEVYVGRIPVYTSGANWAHVLDSILTKIMAYEDSSDIAWRFSALLPMSFSDPDTDGARLGESMKSDYLTRNGFSSWTMYPQGSGACNVASPHEASEELRGGYLVRDRWAATPFGLVTWWGHGSTSGAYVGYEEYDYSGSWTRSCWDEDASGHAQIFETSDAASLDDFHPAVVYQNSCTNGEPEASSNLGHALLEKGAIATVSASRVSWYAVGPWSPSLWYADNAAIGYAFMHGVAQGEPFGEALYDAKQSMGAYWQAESWMNLMDFNLYGDPSLSITSSGDGMPDAGPTPIAPPDAFPGPTPTETPTAIPSPTVPTAPTALPTLTATPLPTVATSPTPARTVTPDATPPSNAPPAAAPPAIAAPGIYDDASPFIRYGRGWVSLRATKSQWGTLHRSSRPGSTATLRFRGSRVHIGYRAAPSAGSLAVYIDGKRTGVIRQARLKKASRGWRVPAVFRASRVHRLKLRAMNARATIDYIVVR